MTCQVTVLTRTGVVIHTPPVLSKFRGQPVGNILKWMTNKHWHPKFQELRND